MGSGKNNKYGHPSEEVIQRLKEIDSKILRTDQTGEIFIEINKKGKITNNIHR